MSPDDTSAHISASATLKVIPNLARLCCIVGVVFPFQYHDVQYSDY